MVALFYIIRYYLKAWHTVRARFVTNNVDVIIIVKALIQIPFTFSNIWTTFLERSSLVVRVAWLREFVPGTEAWALLCAALYDLWVPSSALGWGLAAAMAVTPQSHAVLSRMSGPRLQVLL